MRRPKYPPLYRPNIEDVPHRYLISEWNVEKRITGEILAMADNAIVAAAAFKAAGEQRPNRVIVLCQGARIIDWYPARPKNA